MRIRLSAEDEAALLPQLEHILTFVAQLDEVDIDPHESLHRPIVSFTELSHQDDTHADTVSPSDILANVQHPVVNTMVQVTAKLSET